MEFIKSLRTVFKEETKKTQSAAQLTLQVISWRNQLFSQLNSNDDLCYGAAESCLIRLMWHIKNPFILAQFSVILTATSPSTGGKKSPYRVKKDTLPPSL